MEDLGFRTTVDVTPCVAGQPIILSIEGRTHKTDIIDHERKQYEVRKRIKEKRDPDNRTDEIEGMV